MAENCFYYVSGKSFLIEGSYHVIQLGIENLTLKSNLKITVLVLKKKLLKLLLMTETLISEVVINFDNLYFNFLICISTFGKYFGYLIRRISFLSNERFEELLILRTDYKVDHYILYNIIIISFVEQTIRQNK